MFCFHTPAHQPLSCWATSVKERRNSERRTGENVEREKRQRQSSSDEASASDTETHQPSSSRTRSERPPSRYRDEETADSDESDMSASYVVVENHQSKIQLCSGSIVTRVASGPTPTVPWDATQLHVTLFVYPVLRNEKLVPLL